MIGDRQRVDSTIPSPVAARRTKLLRWALTIGLSLLALAAIFADTLASGAGLPYFFQRFQTFVTIFLGIFIEAVPFLLIGSVVSGFIEIFVDRTLLDRYLPKHPLLGAMAGAMLGIFFPVCECGVVPVTRRLYEKGLPMSIGVAFLLGAPVINPVVLVSTFSAFGWGPILIGRFVFSFLIATVTGWVFSRAEPAEVLAPQVISTVRLPIPLFVDGLPNQIANSRGGDALRIAGDDFLDMSRYLIVGSMLAATMQTIVPQSALLAVGQGPVVSVLVMQALAFVLSICSTVDAFLALAFVGTFTTGSIVSFLVFGPMVDIKSAIMFLSVFRRRAVGYLILLPFLLSLLAGVWWNFNIR
jgi:uncharacterized membrane protein YraQ (UPF0718 family)